MFSGLLGGLFLAWLLQFFLGASSVFIEVLQPLINVTLTNSHYYFTFALIGLIAGLINRNF